MDLQTNINIYNNWKKVKYKYELLISTYILEYASIILEFNSKHTYRLFVY